MEENKTEVTVLSVEFSRAVQADALVESGLELAYTGITKICEGVKLMHDDKLYKEFGFQNFEEYCKSKGFTKQYGNQLVKIAKMMEEENGNSSFHFENLGAKKLYQLAMLKPEQRAEVIQTFDVESVTVKELKAICDQSKARIQELEDKQKQSESTLQKKQSEIMELEKQVQELENRPVEVMQSTAELEEIERLKSEISSLKQNILTLEAEKEGLSDTVTELEDKVNEFESSPLTAGGGNRRQVEEEIAQAVDNATKGLIQQNQNMQEENLKQICDLKKELAEKENQLTEKEKQLAEKSDIPEESPEVKAFRTRMTTVGDNMTQLLNFLCENPDTAFLDNSENMLKGMLKSLDEIRKQVQV